MGFVKREILAFTEINFRFEAQPAGGVGAAHEGGRGAAPPGARLFQKSLEKSARGGCLRKMFIESKCPPDTLTLWTPFYVPLAPARSVFADWLSCRFMIPFEFLDFFGNPLKGRMWKLELKWGGHCATAPFSFSTSKSNLTTNGFPYYRHYIIGFYLTHSKGHWHSPNERERVPIRKRGSPEGQSVRGTL